MTIRAISKVAETCKRDKKIRPTFRKGGTIIYDEHILSWKGVDTVSLLTLRGGKIIPVKYGVYQEERLNRTHTQANLIFRNFVFCLAVVVDIPEPPVYDAKE
ncbi:MAG: hypothetical protein QXV84_00835 [Conexivisphaerales archaeon]